MKKQIKDCTSKEIEENIDNPKVLALIGFYTTYNNGNLEFEDTYKIVCKLKELLEQEIEVKE